MLREPEPLLTCHARPAQRRRLFRRLGHALATNILAAACGTISFTIRLIGRFFWLWSYGAKSYHPVLDRLAALYALLTCRLARRTVPAYARMLDTSQLWLRRLEDFPETSKENYVKVYDLADQCRHGRLKLDRVTVDESSGSTGVPYNWLRSAKELAHLHFNLANYIRLLLPKDDLFCINAFSLGAWGTGMNFSAAMLKVGLVKSIGPDVNAIISTLETFGPAYNYVITAYPPFLKSLSDELEVLGIPPRHYRLFGLVAGEPITETLRSYLLRRFEKVYSGYGASDVSIGIGGETDLTVSIRKALADPGFRYALLGDGEDRIPMIFQYNPLEVFVEVNAESELVFTVTNTAALCPKLRYNLHDEGKILSFESLLAISRRYSPNIVTQALRGIRLPFLFLFGRTDSTISVMGANIYPHDVEHGLYVKPDLARHIRRFCLTLEEGSDIRSLPTINLELRDEKDGDTDLRRQMESELGDEVTKFLVRSSRDFANAHFEDSQSTTIRVRTFGRGEGPFAAKGSGIKNRYLVRLRADDEYY